MNYKLKLLNNISKIHTTDGGYNRIIKNLRLVNKDPVDYSVSIIQNEDSQVEKRGKNYYVLYKDIIITVNSYSFTIITAHIRNS